jgi:chemotaxis protein MotB
VALKAQNAEQDNALAALAARSATEQTAASGTIDSLNDDLRALQAENAGLKADLVALNERYEAERLSASDTIGNLKTDLLAIQSENASQQKDLAALTDRYDSDSAASAGEIAVLRADLLETQTQNAVQKEELKALTARCETDSAVSTTKIIELQTELEKARKATGQKQSISIKSSREMMVLNRQVAELRTQLQNLQGLLDDGSYDGEKLVKEVQLQNLGCKLNSALAQVAAKERKSREILESELDSALAQVAAQERIRRNLENRIGELNKRLLKASQRPKLRQVEQKPPRTSPSNQDVIKFP